jgi:myosin heavy subunit
MELLEDNHRVELRVYQQKVKHLEFEHRNSIKAIVDEGTASLQNEQNTHEKKARELLRMKEQLKFEQMELELVNANKVTEVKQQHEKQLAKLRQQLEEGEREHMERCENRMKKLESDLELRRKVCIHEVEERKNQHINDLLSNHRKSMRQMKNYYNDTTHGNLLMIRQLQGEVNEIKSRSASNKKLLLEYEIENKKLSIPLMAAKTELEELQNQLKERPKDQMALRNVNARLAAVRNNASHTKQKLTQLQEEYAQVERGHSLLYNGFEESIQRVRAQSEFQNETLEQRLHAAQNNVEKAELQVQEIIGAANLDANEVARIITSLNYMLTAKDDALKNLKLNAIKLQKSFHDLLLGYISKLKELGVPTDDIAELISKMEKLPEGSTEAPMASLVVK